MAQPNAHESQPWLPGRPGGLSRLVVWAAPDGTHCLATTGLDGTVRFWNGDTGEPLGPPSSNHRYSVRAVVAYESAAGQGIATAGTEGVVTFWDPVTARVLETLDALHTGGILALASWKSGPQTRLASGSYDGTVRIWDIDSHTLVRGPLVGHTAPVVSLVFWCNADGQFRLASGSDDGTVRVWDPEAGSLVVGPLGQGSTVESLCCWTGTDGVVRLAAGRDDGIIELWDPETGTELERFTASTGVWCLSSWSDADEVSWLAAGSANGQIHIWQIDAPVVHRVLETNSGKPITGLATWQGPDGHRRIAAAAVDGALRVWDHPTGEQLYAVSTGHTAAMWALAHWRGGSGERLAAAGVDGVVRIWHPDSGVLVRSIETQDPGVWTMSCIQAVDGEWWLITGGLNGVIRIWNAQSGEPVGVPMVGHTAALSALTAWRRDDGTWRIASVGDDSALCVWDPLTQELIGDRRVAHAGGLLSVCHWRAADGTFRVATAGADTVIKIWDPEIGTVIQELHGHEHTVISVCVWTDPGGAVTLVSCDIKGMVRVWESETGQFISAAGSGHRGTVRSLCAWVNAEGKVGLAVGGIGGINILEAQTLRPYGKPLVGHTAGIRALAAWRREDGSVRLASTGDDGTIRLWDPETGEAIRTVEAGPLEIWGFSDAPARADVLGRNVLVDAIVDQICQPPDSVDRSLSGPAVVTIEGPWGCGKSTLMHLIRQKLYERWKPKAADASSKGDARFKRLTVRRAMRLAPTPSSALETREAVQATQTPGIITAWFNPWLHQSGEQIWAGLTSTIVEAAKPVLYPTDSKREYYWFRWNIGRMDRQAVRRILRRRILSPLLGVALVAVAVPMAISLLQLDRPLRLAGHEFDPAAIALLPPIGFLLAGVVHTVLRYYWGSASDYLPAPLFQGPVGETPSVVGTDRALGADRVGATQVMDPLREAKAGSLYLHQHGVNAVLTDIRSAGYELVVFVDDLDRCRPATVAEVFEAVNVFLSGITAESPRASFVIGFDPAVVVAHLDRVYGHDADALVGEHGEDPSPGWAFLRKLVQLPVHLPRVSESAVDAFIASVTSTSGSAATPRGSTAREVVPQIDPPRSQAARTADSIPAPHGAPIPRPESRQESGNDIGTIGTPVRVIPWRSLERHPSISSLLRQRLASQPEPSIREAKRLINVWQFLERRYSVMEPLNDVTAVLDRAQRLIILAEIVTRWPAIHRNLHRLVDGRTGLEILASSAADDAQWSEAVVQVGIDNNRHARALQALRGLLVEYWGSEVASLAARVY